MQFPSRLSPGLLALGFLFTGYARAELLTGLVAGPTVMNGIVTFDSATPGMTSAIKPVTGLGIAEILLGIDYRPTTGELFGLGSGNNLYVINRSTGVATLRGMLMADPTDMSSPFTSLSGTSFGVDFNPVPDLAGNPSFRVVSNADQNLRINANNGNVFTDTDINPASSNIVASAYSNNDVLPSTGTTLYGIDSMTDGLVTQMPANDGTILALGPLGVDVSELVAFDISRSGVAFLAVNGASSVTLHTVNLATGAATPVGEIGSGLQLRGITAGPAVPEPSTYALITLGLVGLAVKKRVSQRKARAILSE